MATDRPERDRSRVIGVRMTEEEIAELPAADSDAARVRMALYASRQVRAFADVLPALVDQLVALRSAADDMKSSLAAHQSTIGAIVDARLRALLDGETPFDRPPLEADVRDVEAIATDAAMLAMEAWEQTLASHTAIVVIRDKLMTGEERDAALARQETLFDEYKDAHFRKLRDRALRVYVETEPWRAMREREASEAATAASEKPSGAPAASAAAE